MTQHHDHNMMNIMNKMLIIMIVMMMMTMITCLLLDNRIVGHREVDKGVNQRDAAGEEKNVADCDDDRDDRDYDYHHGHDDHDDHDYDDHHEGLCNIHVFTVHFHLSFNDINGIHRNKNCPRDDSDDSDDDDVKDDEKGKRGDDDH